MRRIFTERLSDGTKVRHKKVVIFGGAHHKMPTLPPTVVVKLPLQAGGIFLRRITDTEK